MKHSVIIIVLLTFLINERANGQKSSDANLDKRVKEFLELREGTWKDMNIPAKDGELLYDLIIKNGYTSALEIGTSTGLSGIYMAWALSKTGGKLITIEINEERYYEAIGNFREAGLLPYIDARLANAHTLVKELEGPFDFVFSDADKNWYKQYFIDLEPKIASGGCFTAHNVNNAYWGIKEFLDYLKNQNNYKTTIKGSKESGISVSYKMN